MPVATKPVQRQITTLLRSVLALKEARELTRAGSPEREQLDVFTALLLDFVHGLEGGPGPREEVAA